MDEVNLNVDIKINECKDENFGKNEIMKLVNT